MSDIEYELRAEDLANRLMDGYWCCNGDGCGCGGVTFRDMAESDPENPEEPKEQEDE
jgi:hypothetical protein